MEIYNGFDDSTGNISLSKGNQLKIHLNDLWYKADFLGYEGASEVVCSELLAYTNIKDYICYEFEKISFNDNTYNGCKSKHFLNKYEEIITIDRLHKKYVNKPISLALEGKTVKDKIIYTVNFVKNITNITNFGQLLTQMLEWDSFVLNEDRHFNNIAVIYNKNTKQYKKCPLFDNGAAFLSDIREGYPLEKNIYGLISKVKSKPFCEDFEKQVQACEDIYGVHLKIDKNIHLSDDLINEIKINYGEKVLDRIVKTLDNQIYLSDYICSYFKESINLDINETDIELD